MKRVRIVTLLLAFLIATPSLLHAQIIKGEVFLGGNMTQVDGDECYGFKKFGAHAGAGALIPLTNWMDIGLEVLFNQKGAYKRKAITSNSTFPYAYNLRLNYAEIPVMIYLTDKDVVSVGLGVSYGRLVGLNELKDGEPFDYEGVGIGVGAHVFFYAKELCGDSICRVDIAAYICSCHGVCGCGSGGVCNYVFTIFPFCA
jgi:hypothetical protein